MDTYAENGGIRTQTTISIIIPMVEKLKRAIQANISSKSGEGRYLPGPARDAGVAGADDECDPLHS